MNLRNVFAVNAVVTVFFAVLLALVPTQTGNFYAITLDEAGAWIARLLGASFLGYSVVAWLAKDAEPSVARRAILPGFLTSNVAGFVVSLVAQLSGYANGLGWLTVAIYLLFAAAYSYFAFMRPEAARPRMAG